MPFLNNLLSYNPFAQFFQKADVVSDKKEAMSVKNSQGISELQAMRNSVYNNDYLGGDNSIGISTTAITWDQSFGNKTSKISTYRQMSYWPEIDIAISQVCDESIVQDASGNVVNLSITEELPTHIEEQIRNKWNYLVNDVFAFNSRGWDLFRKWLVEAELFIELVLNDEGNNIIDIKILPAYTVQPVYQNDRIVSYIQVKTTGKTGSDLESVDEVPRPFDKDQIVYVHYGVPGDSILDIRGYLEPATRLYNQLKNLEDSLIINRIARAPERRLWNIDVGKMPKGKAEEYLKGMIQRYRKRLIYDPETGAMNSTQNIQSMLEDYWFAKQEGSTGTTVEIFKGETDLGNINDINYFLKKLYMSLKLPRSRWDDNSSANNYSSGKSGEILREEIQFSKFVERLQRRFSYVLMNSFLTLLKLSGIDQKYINEDLYNVKFVTGNLFKEYRQMELLEAKFGLLSNIDNYIYNKDDKKGIFAPEFVLKKFIMMTDEDLRENEEAIQRLNGGINKEDEQSNPENEFNNEIGNEIETPQPESLGTSNIGSETGLENNEQPNQLPTNPAPETNPLPTNPNAEITTNTITAPESKSFGNKVKNSSGLFSTWSKIDGSIKNKYSNKTGLISKDKKIV